MNRKKLIFLSFLVTFIGMLITAGTFAFFNWQSNNNKGLSFNVASNLKNYIEYDNGDSTFVGNFQVSNSFTDGIHSTISVKKKQEAASISMVATINMDINAIGPNMAKSSALKWVVTRGNSSSVEPVLSQGNFIGSKSGDTLMLLPNIEVTTSVKEYTIWIWLDINEHPSDALSGETLDTAVWTQIEQLAGMEEIYEITKISANYQRISATVINNKNVITKYAITTSNNTPTNWTNIDTNLQNNIYNLEYDTSATGTYYVWFMDSASKTVSASISVTNIDTTAPSCTFGEFSVTPIRNNETSQIILTCTDNESTIENHTITKDNLVTSSSVVNVTNVRKEQVTNGYKYTITVTGTETDGSATLTLPANIIRNSMHLGNEITTSTASVIVRNIIDLSSASITLNPTNFIYDGTAKTPSITVTLDGNTLTRNTDYSASFANNINVGTATVYITGINDYEGSASATFTITGASIDAGMSLTGTPTWGEDLNITPTCNVPSSGCSYSYQWYESDTNSTTGGSAITGATSSTYAIEMNKVNKYIYVVVTITANNYETKEVATITPNKIAKRYLDITTTNYSGVYDGSIHYATIKVNSEYWNGATIVSGTSTTYGNNVTTSGTTNTFYNLLPGLTNATNGVTNIYYQVSGGSYYRDTTGSATINITPAECDAPTNVAITPTGLVNWTNAGNATGYEISIDGTTYTEATNGMNYNSTITASTGTRTVYVRSICNSNYNSPSNSASATTTVYNVTLTKGTGISTVTGAGNYITGATVSINATLDTDYVWSKWTSGSTVISTTKAYSATITSNWAYTANAIEKVYELQNSSGSITGYTDNLSDAFTNVVTGGSIIALKDNTSNASTTNTKNVTLDTNGKTITLTNAITNSSTYTLTINGGGTITTSGTIYIIINYGSLTTSSVTLSKTNDNGVIRNSGTYTSNTGTTITHTSTHGVLMVEGTLNFYDGTINTSGPGVYKHGNVDTGVATLNMYGGTITSTSAYGIATDSNINNLNINISGGSITGQHGMRIAGNASVIISNGIITGTNSAGIALTGNTTTVSVNVMGGIITGSNTGFNIVDCNNANITISSGTITGSTHYGIMISGTSTTASVSVSGGSINGGIHGIYNVSGANAIINITNGNINGNGDSGIRLYDTTTTSLNISGGSITGQYHGLLIASPATAIVSINNGELRGLRGITCESNNATITLGENNSTINSNPKIIGTQPAMYMTVGTWNWYDGELYSTNSSTYTTNPGDTPKGYSPKTVSDTTYAANGYKTYLSNEYTVTANASGGSIASTNGWSGTGASATKNITYGSTYGTLPSISKSGYAFIGWSVSKLPSDYQQVEYIEANGTQWIDSGVTPTLNSKMEIKLNSQYIGESAIFGSDWSLNGSFLMFYNNAIRWHSATAVDVPASLNTDYVIETGNGYLKVNGTNYSNTPSTSISQNSLKLYYTPNTNNRPNGQFKTYYWKIYDGNTLVRDFVPCYRKSDGVAGLYDVVNGVFYTNSGSGSFGIGLPSTYQRVEYIESTGVQYIDTGINPSGKEIGVDVTFQYTNTTNDKWFFGENTYSSGDVGAYELGIYNGKFLFLMTKYDKTQLNVINVTPSDTNKHNLKYNITNYGTSFDNVFLHNEIQNNNDAGNIIDTANHNLYIFGRSGNLSSSMWASVKIYSFKIYDGTHIIRDYIPCYRKSDGVAGLYDVVNGVFYTNSGSGIFNVGSNVNVEDIITENTINNIASNHTIYANWTANELTFNNQTLSSGTYATAYTSTAFTGAANGTGNYTYTIKSGAPAGATINSTNRTISFNNSTTPGTYSVVVTATDNNSGKTKDATMQVTINKATLIPSVGTCSNKTYDGGTGATCTFNLATVKNGDTVTASGTCVFADKNVGNAKTITCTGITISGAQASYYQLSAASASKTSAASITKRSLTPSVGTCSNKTYDGGTGASCGISVATVLSGDTVTASGTCNFADKNVGNAKTITCTGITLGGAQAGNYQLSAASASKTSAASITKRSLTPSVGTCSNKTYDGGTGASCGISIATVLSGDTVTASGTCNFADKNVGNAKTITCTGITLGGAQAGNYQLSAASASKTSAASITKRSLTPSVGTCSNKTYDGGTGASCGISVATILSGDTVTASGTCNFADKNVGNAKTITCTGITLGGSQAGNYQLSAASASKTSAASITKRSLTPSVGTCSNKTYDGGTGATCGISIATVLSGDTVTASGTCNFADKNVGNAKTITCTGITLGGAQAGNYQLSAASASKTSAASITKRSLTPSVGTCNNKTYDGGTGASCGISVATVLSGDTVTASGTCNFADKAVGNAKTITCTGITLGGAQAGNYQLSTASASKGSAASITKRSLTPSIGTCSNKTYNGNASASCTISIATVVSGDTVTASGTCNFADANAGNAKTVTCTGISLGGAHAGYYQLSAASASKTSAASILKATCTAPTGISISAAGVVTWTNSGTASSYQISINNSSYTAATSGVNYKSTIIAAAGNRTVYVRSVCNSTNYNTPSAASSTSISVYTVTLTKGTGISAVSGGGNYIKGSTAAIDATVTSGYNWSKWTQTSGGAQVTTTKAYSAAVNANWAYTANAVAASCTLIFNVTNAYSYLTSASFSSSQWGGGVTASSVASINIAIGSSASLPNSIGAYSRIISHRPPVMDGYQQGLWCNTINASIDPRDATYGWCRDATARYFAGDLLTVPVSDTYTCTTAGTYTFYGGITYFNSLE